MGTLQRTRACYPAANTASVMNSCAETLWEYETYCTDDTTTDDAWALWHLWECSILYPTILNKGEITQKKMLYIYILDAKYLADANANILPVFSLVCPFGLLNCNFHKTEPSTLTKLLWRSPSAPLDKISDTPRGVAVTGGLSIYREEEEDRAYFATVPTVCTGSKIKHSICYLIGQEVHHLPYKMENDASFSPLWSCHPSAMSPPPPYW